MYKKVCAVNKSIHRNTMFSALTGRKHCFIFSFIILFLSLTLCPLSRSEEPIVINITVNSVSKGDFFVIRDAQGNFFVKKEDIAALAIKLPESAGTIEIEKNFYIPLSSLKDFKIEFDEKKLLLSITSPVASLPKTTIDLSSGYSSYKDVYYPREKSIFLNYALNYSYSDYSYDYPEGPNEFMLVNKFGARSGDFFFITDTQYTKNELNSDFLRLMSYVTYERPRHLQWITLGDMFASSGSLGSTINIGGLGISKVYKMNPYLVRQPTMNFSGAAALPSQVDIYVDGVLTGRRNIMPGQFEIQNLNYYGGTRNVDLVIRDPFGIEQRFQYSVYFERTLLKNQFHEYSYNIGWLRENYGMRSNEYGKPAFSAFHRYGVTDWLTIGASGEAADDVYNGSIESTFLVPFSAGVMTMGLAGSKSQSITGWAGALSHSYQNRKFSSSTFFTKYSSDYANIADRLSSSAVDYVASIEASYYMTQWGALSVGYWQQSSYDAGDKKIASAHYSYNLTNSLTLGTSIQAIKSDSEETDYQFSLSLNYHSPKGLRAYGQYQSTRDGNNETIQISRDQPTGEGWGGEIYANREGRNSSGTSEIINPRLQYNGRYGTYTWDSYFQDSGNFKQEVHNIGVAGSVVYAGGFFGLTRPVNDSFGFVMVDRLSDVPVSVNNQVIGKTDKSGLLIIPTLQSYNINNVDLTTKDIPMNYRISEVSRKISPSIWSGSCISLDAQKITAVTGTLFMQKDGRKTPLEYVEMSVKVGDRNFAYPTGKGGEFYMENILPEEKQGEKTDRYSCRAIAELRKSGGNMIKPGKYPAIVEHERGKCELIIIFPETEETITDIGEIECVSTPTSMPSALSSSAEMPVKPAVPQAVKELSSVSDTRPESTPASTAQETSPVQKPLPARKDVEVAGAVKKQEKCTMTLVVHFDTRKAVIKKKYREGLKKMADYLKAHPEMSVVIDGHTDNVDIYGEPVRNIRLSNVRAEVLRQYLLEKSGIEGARISAMGHSFHKAVASNQTVKGRQKNRRAEICVDLIQTK